MAFHLTSKEQNDLAKRSSVAPRAIERLLSGVVVYLSPEGQSPEGAFPKGQREPEESPQNTPGSNTLQLGLALSGEAFSDPRIVMRRADLIALVASAIRRYRACCPKVFQWLASGSFNPKKIPEDLSAPMIVHACRTAGRLRAELIRQVNAQRGH